LRFKQITINNFGVFSGEQTFDLKPESSHGDSKPIIIFGGKNGTGKTTFLEAFKICLYGSLFKGKKLPNSDYNRHIQLRLHRAPDGKKATYASIALEFDYARLGNIDSYLVKRSWTNNESGILEKLYVEENGRPLTQVNKEQWQNFIMELIPPGLSKLFFFDGEKIQSLARGQAVNRYIIESINSLLGLDLIERLRYDIKLYCSNELPDRGQDFQAKLAETLSKLTSLETKLDSARQHKASLQNRVIQIENQITVQELKISAEGGGFASQREKLKEKIKELETKIEFKKDEIRSLCSSLLPFATVPKLCQSLRERLQSEEKEQQRQATLAYLSALATDLAQDIGNDLSLDALDLSIEEKQLVAREAICVLRKKIEKLNDGSKETVHAVSSSERRDLLNWIEMASRVPRKLKDATSELQELKSQYKTNQQYLFSAPEDDILKPLLLRLGNLREELGKVKEQQNTIEQEIKTMEKSMEVLNREKEKLLNEQRTYDKSNKRLDLAARTQEVIEEYLRSLRNVKVIEFRDNFLECFNLLFSKHDLISTVQINENTFDVTLLTKQGVAISKSEFSAGERQIYAMAMIWALAKTSGRTLPFIIDTPLGRLDTDHRENVLNNFFADASHQMIIFSTNTEVDRYYFDQLNSHIAKAYNLEYSSEKGQTTVKVGYFWENEVTL
jgi:DNA sulfur modification protein DndD